MLKREKFLGRWLGLLFWLIIPNVIASLMTNDTVMKYSPDLYRIGQILDLVCDAAYCAILIRLSSEEARYRTAGICILISDAAGVLDRVFAIETAGFPIWDLAALLLSMVGMYYEYKAHSTVLADVYNQLSQKWMVLWKGCLGSMIALFCFMILIPIVPRVGLIGSMLALIAFAVVSIMKTVYLYRTAEAFRTFL